MQYFTIDSYTFVHNPTQEQDTLTYQGADLQMLDGTWYAQPAAIPSQTTGFVRTIALTATIYQPMTRFAARFSVGSQTWEGLAYDATHGQLWAWIGGGVQSFTSAGVSTGITTSYGGPTGGAFANLSPTPTGTLMVGWSDGTVGEMDPTSGSIVSSSTALTATGATFAGVAGSGGTIWGLTTAGGLYQSTGGTPVSYPPLAAHETADFAGLTMDPLGYLWSTRTQEAQAVCFSPRGRQIGGEELRDVGPYTWLPNGLALLYRPTLNQLQQVRLNSVDRDVDHLRTVLMGGQVSLTDEQNVTRQVTVTALSVASSLKYIRGYDVTIQVTETI